MHLCCCYDLLPLGNRAQIEIDRKIHCHLADLVNKLLADSDEPLLIELAANQIRFKFGQISLVSKLIDGKFPDYERVIPATLKNVVTLNRATLLSVGLAVVMIVAAVLLITTTIRLSAMPAPSSPPVSAASGAAVRTSTQRRSGWCLTTRA